MPIATIDPTTGETVKAFDPLSDAEVQARVALAAKAFPAFRATTFAERADILNAVARICNPCTNSERLLAAPSETRIASG